MANCKLFLTDNNYQSYQSSTSNYHFYWKKIGKIGNYCQFSIGDAFALNYSLKLIKPKQVVELRLS